MKYITKIWGLCCCTALMLIAAQASAQEQFQKEIYYASDSVKLKEVIHFTKADTTLHGSYESFHLNGSLQTFGHYLNGLPDSIWVYYYVNGRKRAEGRFEQGRTQGKWTYHYENGNKKSEGILQDNIKNGNWTFFYETGKPKSTGTYNDDVKFGIWNYFYEDEVVKAQSYYENGIGIYKEFYPSGSIKMEGENREDKSIGDWIYYYESGEIQAKGSFEDGLRVGEWKYFHPNGEDAIVGKFGAGLESGIWRHYHEDGEMKAEGAMEDGERDGFWKLYYPTGDLKGEGDYQTGNGEYTEFYTSGKQKTKGQIKKGLKHGKWIFYSEDGLVDGEVDFIKGEGRYKGFYPDGSVKMEGDMKDDRRVGEWSLFNSDGSLAGTYRPIYEDEKPIFKTRQSATFRDPINSEKPEYLFENNQIRYFTSTINEYKGIAVETNPAGILFGSLPLAVERHIQERLGYQVQIVLHRDPFFSPLNESIGEVYTQGGTIQFKQKFYHPDRKLGMWYFGHLVGLSYLSHSSKILDDTFILNIGEITENRLYYGVIVGSRWMQRTADSGFTFDGYVGFGMGARNFNKQYGVDPDFDAKFADTIKNKGYFPFFVGLNIGLIGPKRRLSK
ncbi:MAG: toxin-antitoxin system YwqK family antitoxin [Cytophagales bacterium]|nr:toxin-antitoxin system YwqK family antitoxin [Cytophagales bacterium]